MQIVRNLIGFAFWTMVAWGCYVALYVIS